MSAKTTMTKPICHDCGLNEYGDVYVRYPYKHLLCEKCEDRRNDRIDAQAAQQRDNVECERLRVELEKHKKEIARIKKRLRFLSPPTDREKEALRRMADVEDDTSEDRRLLRRRGWSRPMSDGSGDLLTGNGRAIARRYGLLPVLKSESES